MRFLFMEKKSEGSRPWQANTTLSDTVTISPLRHSAGSNPAFYSLPAAAVALCAISGVPAAFRGCLRWASFLRL